MKKNHIISLLVFFSIVLIGTLYFYSNRNVYLENGFNRTFAKEDVILKNKTVLEDVLFSIEGITLDSIFLYKYRKPYEWMTLTKDLKKKKIHGLPLANKEKFIGMNTLAFRDSFSFLLSGMTSVVYKIYPDQKTVKASKLDSLPFYQSELIGKNSFAFISKVKHEGIFRRKLKKVDVNGKELRSYMPEKQFDGYFCTDGQFKYNEDSGLLVYMYYYRGEFACLDSNLKMKYIAKTIDTVKSAKIHLKSTKNMVTHATPPNIVSKRMCVTKDKIYIQSNLKADNEDGNEFGNSEVIDVYDLKDGRYDFSFYLPKFEKLKITAFKVYEDILVTIYHNTLVVFKIPQNKG